MSRVRRRNITYKRLGQTLTKLGFVRNDGDSFTAFSDESRGALIVLPQTPPDEQVSDRHLIAVERTLEGKGIASPDRFYEVLSSRASEHRTVTVKGGASTPKKGRPAVKQA
jgi:hypothetical protein